MLNCALLDPVAKVAVGCATPSWYALNVRFSPESQPVPLHAGKRFPQFNVRVLVDELLVEMSSELKVNVCGVLGLFPLPEAKQFPPPSFPPTTRDVVPVTLFGAWVASDIAKALAPVEV